MLNTAAALWRSDGRGGDRAASARAAAAVHALLLQRCSPATAATDCRRRLACWPGDIVATDANNEVAV